MSGLAQCLAATLSSDKATRTGAEAQLKAGGDQPGFTIQLVGIMQVRHRRRRRHRRERELASLR